jgi:hypothetical protein
MTDNRSGSTNTTSQPLRRDVSTGTDNPVDVAPYEVLAVRVPRRWDPSTEALAVSYDINNPNQRATRGRIVYKVPGTLEPGRDGAVMGDTVIVHRQALTFSQIRSGSFELPPSQRWDGTITEGLPERTGRKVTADVAPIYVVVELWNRSTPQPGNRPGESSGATDVRGEYVARGRARAELDVFTEARWDRNFVIPYGDPDEPDAGTARMIIRVRNVAEGTPARLFVYRIGNLADPWSDRRYMYSGAWPVEQPLLEGATVRNGRVLLRDGSKPGVRFNNYAQHWTQPGNNFYCFRVAFGNRGGGLEASERDYVNHERDCLHLRFTVFIHSVAGDLHEYSHWGSQLHRFFRSDTKYYRPYIMTGSPRDLEDWRRHFRHRYIVILFSHGSCGCYHIDHPREDGELDGRRMDLYHSGFAPDQNICPTGILDTPEARRDLEAARRHYRCDFGGCGHKSHVYHRNWLGSVAVRGSRRRTTFSIHNHPGRVERDDLVIAPDPTGEALHLVLSTDAPRLFVWNGGCRTMLTTNLGEYFVQNGTKYYHGWIYSPLGDYGRIAYDVFTRWIQGTPADPAPDEWDVARLVPAYRDAASRGTRPRYYPRIMDREHGVLNPAAAPGGTERALR